MNSEPGVAKQTDAAIDAAVVALFDRQRADGSWQDHLPSAAVSTATSIVALHAAAPHLTELPDVSDLVVNGARWLREHQNPDGGWGDAAGAPATLNATAIADAALRYVAAAKSTDTLRRSQAWIDRHGGRAAVADRTRCTLSVIAVNVLAAAGTIPHGYPARLPFELILLPRVFRQKLSFTVPGLMSFGLMHAHTRPTGPIRRLLVRLARPRALNYLAELQCYEDRTGTSLSAAMGGYQESALMSSVVCFGVARSGLPTTSSVARTIVRRCVRFLRGTVRPDGSWPVNRDLEFSASMMCVHGLIDAGYADDRRLHPTRDWILASQRTDSFPATGCPPGSWGWSLPSGWPNTDDTCSAVLALTGLPDTGYGNAIGDGRTAVTSGVRWLRAMQNRDGSWGCFTRNAPITLDAPCSIFTAHAVLSLHQGGGLTPQDPPLARAIGWFGRKQQADGRISALWYRDHTSGTARVLYALARLGLADSPTARGCRDWLLAHPNSDGGWGDGAGSASTAEETAWAVLGLVEAGLTSHHAVTRGVGWLCAAQRDDGLWQPTILGVYFLDLMYHDDLICAGYALQALGRYRAALDGRGAAVGGNT